MGKRDVGWGHILDNKIFPSHVNTSKEKCIKKSVSHLTILDF